MKRDTMFNAMPATAWTDATPVGNGKMGALVYGCVYDERIALNHEQIYSRQSNAEIPDISNELQPLRDMMSRREYDRANGWYTRCLTEHGYNVGTGFYMPTFDLHFTQKVCNACTGYRRELDMRHGIVRVKWNDGDQKFCREIFVSQKYDLIFIRFTGEDCIKLRAVFEPHDGADRLDFAGNICPEEGTYSYRIFENGAFAQGERQGTKFCARMKVLRGDSCRISPVRRDGPEMNGEEFFCGDHVRISGKEILLAVCVRPSDRDEEICVNEPYEKIFEEHCEAFSKIYSRMTLQISEGSDQSNEDLLLKAYSGEVPAALVERMANFGRYLLISSSYGSKLPANLQGVWNGSYYPAWCCTFFNNENIQMEYWQAMQGNLCETILPLFSLYERFMDDFRENARKLYGCRGILLPLFMDNQSGKKQNLQPHVLYWTASSSWISGIFYDYYLYTGDTEFLRKHAYPFMKEAALFYEDFMQVENGKLKSWPSNSPENRANGAGRGYLSVSINATMDFAALKELLSNLLEAENILGVRDEKEEVWKRMLSQIPAYEKNEDGAMKEWLHPDFTDNYKHRHLSHIYPLFPGLEVNKKTNPEVFGWIRTAVEKRLVIGLKSQTGWSLAHMSNIYARLQDGNAALNCLELLLRFCTGQNLFTYHNDWRNMGVSLKFVVSGKPPFQIDANMGFAAAVIEMMVYSDRNGIVLLPALPDAWAANGQVKGIRARGGYTADISWKDGVAEAEITASKDGELSVACGRGTFADQTTEKKITLKKGETAKVSFGW